MSIRPLRSGLLPVMAAAALLGLPAPAAAQTGAPSGRLSCQLGAGAGRVITSQRPTECRFIPRRGPVQRYNAVVRDFGIDFGSIRGTTMSWRVYGLYARTPLGALSGRYVRTTTAAGSGGNLLVGGPQNEVTLQPLSLQGARGVNIAIGVTGLELTLIHPRKRR